MKKASQDLFELIKSLTKSEKRYFHLYANRHVLGGKNNYLTLFEYIGRLTTYDEEAVKAHFEGHKFVDYFSVAKRQLYQYVLESLHAFHAGKSVSMQVHQLVHQAEVLLQKGLLLQSRKLLRKAEARARAAEAYAALLQVYALERRVLSRMGLANVPEGRIAKLYQQEQYCLQVLADEKAYAHLLWEVYQLHARRGAARSNKELDKLEQLAANPLLADAARAPTFAARLNFHQIHATLYFMQGEVEQAKQHNQAIIQHFHQQSSQIAELPERYFSALKNYLVDCLVQGQHEEIDQTIAWIRHQIKQPAYKSMTRLQVDIFCLTHTLQLNSYINQGLFLAGKELLPEVERGLKAYQRHIKKQDRITFYHLLAYFYFGMDDFKNALKWVNLILNDSERQLLQHVYAFARLFNLMIHFELGNFDILASLLRASSRYLQKVDQLHEIEQLFIRYFRKILNAPVNRHTQIWKELRQELLTLTQQPHHQQLLQYFNLIPWL
ncbi:MAG: hypothetical protein D6730_24305, partial [Bacteroidetes bacterium]